MSHQTEIFMAVAFRDEAVADLPRVSNNPSEADHGGLRLAQRWNLYRLLTYYWQYKLPTFYIIQNFYQNYYIVSFKHPSEKNYCNIQASETRNL